MTNAMTRYCGQCGAVLDATALRAGHCPWCGTALDADDAALSPSDAALAEHPTQPTAGAYVAAATASPAPGAPDPHANARGGHTSPALPLPVPQRRYRWSGASSPRRHDQQGERRALPPWALLLLSAVVLLLAGAAVYALAQRNPLSIVLAPFTSSNANASSNSSSGAGGSTAAATANGRSTSPTALPHATQTPRSSPVPGASPTPGGSPTPSPGATPTPAPTATATPAPPTLSVYPTSISQLVCLGAQATFTITNTGGQVLSWYASASVTGYQISPSSDSIDPGGKETVTVSSISQSGIVTVSAPGARNAPQQVSITCTL